MHPLDSPGRPLPRGPRWSAYAQSVVQGLVVGVPVAFAAMFLLPADLGRTTLWPAGLGLCVVAVVSTAHAGRTFPMAAANLRWVALAVVTAVALVGGTTAVVPEAWNRGQFSRWIPVLAGTGLALWLGGAALERWKGRRLPAITALIAGVAMASIALQSGHYLASSLSGDRVRAWNVYHYYLGSKYFAELGYHDLYAATVTADDEWIAKKKDLSKKERKKLRKERTLKDFGAVKRVRDMNDYRVKPRAEVVEGYDRSAFTDERWDEFGKDSRWIRSWLSPKIWPSVLTDLGYNPAPPWTVVGTPLSNLVDIRGPVGWIIINSDVPWYGVVLLACLWAFGIRTTAAMALWLHTIQFNEARWTGGFLQYDWLVSCLLALALHRRGRYGSAGVALSWGAMTRVFPGFLVFPIFGKLLWDLFRGGDHREDPDTVSWLPSGNGDSVLDRVIRRAPRRRWAFALAFTASCGVLFGASHLTGQGLDTWPTWVDKIGRHSGTHATTSTQRVGLQRMVLHEPRPGKFWARVPGPRDALVEKTKEKRTLILAVSMLVFLPALLRRRDDDSLALMMFLTFLLVTLSRYYCSVWAMLFALGQKDRDGPGRSGLFAGSVLLAMAAFFYAPPDGKQRLAASAGQYFLVNYEAYAMFMVLCVAYLVSDVKSLRSESDEA